MTNLQEVPTDELLSFQDYPSVPIHSSNSPARASNSAASLSSSSQINVNLDGAFQQQEQQQQQRSNNEDFGAGDNNGDQKSFWTLNYYQKFFDVDTKDVLDRIIASVTPRRDNSLKHHLRTKPDLYGPFWISVTLIFTIAISGNIANYLQHAAKSQYHWRYDFHLVSYAATAICLYVTLIPFTLWGLLKWSSDVNDLDGLEDGTTPGALELICIYGYSLFIYIPAAIFWSIQISFIQWMVVLIAAFISGSVLLFTLMPALRLSRHKLLLIIGIISCHLLLAAGFMLYFFHAPANSSVAPIEQVVVAHNANASTAAPSG